MTVVLSHCSTLIQKNAYNRVFYEEKRFTLLTVLRLKVQDLVVVFVVRVMKASWYMPSQ